MLADISRASHIYIVCGYTDMRKSIDGLCAVIQDQLQMNPSGSSLFLFCGRLCDRIKSLLKESDGYVLINEAEVLCNIAESLPAEEETEEDLICDTSEINQSKPGQKRKTLEEALEGKPFTKRYVDLPEDQKVCPEWGRRTKGMVKSICVRNMTSFLPESRSSSGTASLTNVRNAPATELFRN